MTHPIRVVIVDDHVVLRDGLARLLDDVGGVNVIGCVGTSADAITASVELTPDVVILDHRLPDTDGLRTAAALRRAVPTARIVMFTATDDRRLMTNAEAAGCAAFVAKTAPADEIVAAVKSVAAGEPWPWPVASGGANGSGLTERERVALELAAAGMDNQAIAEALYLSVNTVRNHFQRILAKLGAHSKLEAVAVAASLGLLGVGVGVS